MKKSVVILSVCLGVMLILSMSVASAGLFSWVEDFFAKITGQAVGDGTTLTDGTENCEVVVCIPGDTTECSDSCGNSGIMTCNSLCFWGPCSVSAPLEVCNGLDDDCDGQYDEGFDVDGDGVTICGSDSGSETLILGPVDCDDTNPLILPGVSNSFCNCQDPYPEGTAETCDGLDNDCDGVLDNGVCESTSYYCDADGDGYRSTSISGTCTGYDCVPAGCSVNVGDDCDDDASDDPSWCSDVTNCDDGGIQFSCSDIDGCVFSDCAKCLGAGSQEVVDGVDNDCDGLVDCDDNNSNPVQTSTEVWDGLDNDCDGQYDEGFECSYGALPLPCGPITNDGICEFGTQYCVNGFFGDCIGAIYPQIENSSVGTCDDGLDNDCDSYTDCADWTGVASNCQQPVQDPACCEATCDQECGTDPACGTTCPNTCNVDTQICVGTSCISNCDNDGVCEPGNGESCTTCYSDCAEESAVTCAGLDCGTATNNCGVTISCTDKCVGGEVCNVNSCESVCTDVDGDGYVAESAGPECLLMEGFKGYNDCDDSNPLAYPEPGKAEDCSTDYDDNCIMGNNEDCICTPTNTQVCGESDVPECSKGLQTCGSSGEWIIECVGEVEATTETCNGLNDDCDDETDEGLGGDTCNTGAEGICQEGKMECQGEAGLVCVPVEAAAPEEICGNDLDDDCSGFAEDGCPCEDYRFCGNGKGECVAGTQACVNGFYASECVGEVSPESNIELKCDGKDENCNGEIDEGLSRSCGREYTLGICAPNLEAKQECVRVSAASLSTMADSYGEGETVSKWGECVGEVVPDEKETCNDGLDNDCDGSVDEDCKCTPGNKQSCGSNVGECKGGVQLCSTSGVWEICGGDEYKNQGTETCDGKDNDCDGEVDENSICLLQPNYINPLTGNTIEGEGILGDKKEDDLREVINALERTTLTDAQKSTVIVYAANTILASSFMTSIINNFFMPILSFFGFDFMGTGRVVSADPNDDKDGDGFTVGEGDCDDSDPAIYVGAKEIVGNDKDDDCNGLVDCDDIWNVQIEDLDGDGEYVCVGDSDDTDPNVQ